MSSALSQKSSGKMKISSSRKKFRSSGNSVINPALSQTTSSSASLTKTLPYGQGSDQQMMMSSSLNDLSETRIFDAGGGSGIGNLQFDVLAEEQYNQYKRTLETSDLYEENLEQEFRQTKLVDEYVTITVNVSREDFPSISRDIKVTYCAKALQAAWAEFMVEARKQLDVQFVEAVLDRKDFAPINRTMALRDGGEYFLRQREAGAIMEVIETGKMPEQVSWPITERISIVKDDLKESGRDQVKIDKKVDFIINEPMLREQQRECAYTLMEADNADDIVEAMWEVLNSHDLPHEEYKLAMEAKMKADAEKKRLFEEKQEQLQELIANKGSAEEIMKLSKEIEVGDAGDEKGFSGVSLKRADPEVDIVKLHRLSFECLSRLAIKDAEQRKSIADGAIDYVEKAMVKYREDVDVVVMATKFLSDIVNEMVPHRKRCYHMIMDNIQRYSAANDEFREKRVIRRLLSDQEALDQDEAWERQFRIDTGDLIVDEEERDAEQSKLEFEVKVVGGEEFDLEAYIRELEEKKRLEAERLAAMLKEEDVMSESTVEEEVIVETKKVKRPWAGSVGYIGQLKPEEEEYESIYDDNPNTSGKKKKKLLKGFKPFKGGGRPLPEVPGLKYVGFLGPYSKDIILLQCFTSLYKFIQFSFGNREDAFALHLAEEVASIGLVCIGNPSLLEYGMWIIDSMYMDGFQTDPDDEDTIAPTVDIFLSGSGLSEAGDNNETVTSPVSERDPMIGVDIDCASTVTQPTVDLEGYNQFLEEDIKVNRGDPAADYENVFPKIEDIDPRVDLPEDDSTIETELETTGGKRVEGKAEGVEKVEKAEKEGVKKREGEGVKKKEGEGGEDKDDEDGEEKEEPVELTEAEKGAIAEEEEQARKEKEAEKASRKAQKAADREEKIEQRKEEAKEYENISGSIVIDGEEKEKLQKYKQRELMAENSALKDTLGESLYEHRYKRRPRDPLVLFCAMMSQHCDIQPREQEMGRKWLGVWNDASARFKRLVTIGGGLSGL